jgi:hypothetical protein
MQGANLASLLSAASLRNRLSTDPSVKQAHPGAEDVMHKVNLGGTSFAELLGAHSADIEAMQNALAA